jgi:hypothetical protein
MNSSLSWTPLRCLSDRSKVHKGSGIYLIGVEDISLADPGPDANYYGINYPLSFRPRYVGISLSQRYGIARRLSSHARGKGNRQIKEFILNYGIDKLYYTYSPIENADFAEALFLMHQSENFLNWNNKAELHGPGNRFFFSMDLMSHSCLTVLSQKRY